MATELTSVCFLVPLLKRILNKQFRGVTTCCKNIEKCAVLALKTNECLFVIYWLNSTK